MSNDHDDKMYRSMTDGLRLDGGASKRRKEIGFARQSDADWDEDFPSLARPRNNWVTGQPPLVSHEERLRRQQQGQQSDLFRSPPGRPMYQERRGPTPPSCLSAFFTVWRMPQLAPQVRRNAARQSAPLVGVMGIPLWEIYGGEGYEELMAEVVWPGPWDELFDIYPRATMVVSTSWELDPASQEYIRGQDRMNDKERSWTRADLKEVRDNLLKAAQDHVASGRTTD